jgi:hypothetical protein
MALAGYESSPQLTALEKFVIRYAAEMTRTPVEIPDELFSALGLKSEGFSRGAFCRLPDYNSSLP